MVFVDEVSHLNLDDPTALLRYTYPQDHPFVEGHFPGNPIMMGITQWIGCADAVTWLTYELAQARTCQTFPQKGLKSIPHGPSPLILNLVLKNSIKKCFVWPNQIAKPNPLCA
jgi:3-hydroxymyristoyl/3-hydroxydecanoyl-(acyl carrier protein) dehydratase